MVVSASFATSSEAGGEECSDTAFDRQGNAHGGPMRPGIDVYPAVVIENGTLNDRQSEAHPARFSGAKWREDLVAQIGINTFAVIVNADHDLTRAVAVAHRFRSQRDSRFVLTGHRFGRVRHQVSKRFG